MKAEVLAHCRNIISDKLSTLKKAMADLQESADQDSKSSVGDKYETSRAMIHLEQENLMTQYQEQIRQQDILAQIKNENNTTSINVGSLVETNFGYFYISVGLGKIEIDQFSFFAVAPNSPIGAALLGKQPGDKFILSGRDYIIINTN